MASGRKRDLVASDTVERPLRPADAAAAPATGSGAAPRWPELARRIEGRPWNQPGADKTWLLSAMWEHLAFQRELRRAGRGDAG
jgi:hypothetical protein